MNAFFYLLTIYWHYIISFSCVSFSLVCYICIIKFLGHHDMLVVEWQYSYLQLPTTTTQIQYENIGDMNIAHSSRLFHGCFPSVIFIFTMINAIYCWGVFKNIVYVSMTGAVSSGLRLRHLKAQGAELLKQDLEMFFFNGLFLERIMCLAYNNETMFYQYMFLCVCRWCLNMRESSFTHLQMNLRIRI